MNKLHIAFLLLCIAFGSLEAQTIKEKKAGLGQPFSMADLTEEMRNFLSQVNLEIENLDNELSDLHAEAFRLHVANAPMCDYKELLGRINVIKARRVEVQSAWCDMASQDQMEGYALWHQPNTTLEQLVIDYGSQDYVYLIPDEVGRITLSVNSNLPIPRATWSEMLELILTQNGVGIKQLNPFLRQLFLLKEDRSGLTLITNNCQDLLLLPGNERIAFMLTPEPSDVRRVWFFLEKFINPNCVVLQQIGRDILIIAQVSEIQELLKLYEFVSKNRGDKEYKLVPLSRIEAQEIVKILSAVFGFSAPEAPRAPEPMPRGGPGGRPPMHGGPPRASAEPVNTGDNGLQVIPLTMLANSIFLVGTREEVRKAENLIHDVEAQLGEAHGKVIYWYMTKNSNAEDLADVLFRIYTLMASNQSAFMDGEPRPPGMGGPPPPWESPQTNQKNNVNILPPPMPPPPVRGPFNQGFYLDDSYVVNRRPPPEAPVSNVGRDNFIVDLKTGAIVMVVEADILPRMKELIKKLDVPKKMVQIDVLLFEKKIRSETDFGLSSLKTGSEACHNNSSGSKFNVIDVANTPIGIFNFLISRNAGSFLPAFDAVFRFLLAQENIHINANPSVLAVNQTPAVIDIDEEISVNTGAYPVDTGGPSVALQNAYARARYGIKIEITPTIYAQNEPDFTDCLDGPEDYVTLNTDITFQTINRGTNPSQPDVTTRHILNEVNIPDGQTVILGGLRRRNSREAVEKIPFLGDLPGIGKLFCLTEISDDTTEMFIFLTPKIINDPSEDLERVKVAELMRRPGDVPAFLCCLIAAEEREHEILFESTLTMILGRKPDRCADSSCSGEYDGR